MTEIKVERDDKGGMPWWLWPLLALILVAALLWWILDNDDDAKAVREPVAAEAVVTPVPVVPIVTTGTEGNMAAGGNQMAGGTGSGPITDASMLFGGIDQSMVGRPVQLSNVPVMQVVGDAGFWIGENEQRRTYVVLNEQRTPNTPTEGRVDVNQGQRISLNGTIRTKAEALRGLATGSEATLPQGVDHFLVADRVQIQG